MPSHAALPSDRPPTRVACSLRALVERIGRIVIHGLFRYSACKPECVLAQAGVPRAVRRSAAAGAAGSGSDITRGSWFRAIASRVRHTLAYVSASVALKGRTWVAAFAAVQAWREERRMC